MKKSKYILLSVFLLASLWLFTEKVSAYELPDDCFYTNPDRRDEVYSLLCESGIIFDGDKCRDEQGNVYYVLKDSMYAEYSVNAYNYNSSWQPTFRILGKDRAGNLCLGNNNCVEYYFKIIGEQDVEGTLDVEYLNGSILDSHIFRYDWIDDVRGTSDSYADYAERISKLLGLDHIIPATHVRRVVFAWVNPRNPIRGFWIKHKGIEAFVPYTSMQKDEKYFPAKEIYNKEELYDLCRQISDAWKAHEEKMKEWKALGPQYIPMGYFPVMKIDNPQVPESQINNIINITEYLHLDKVKWRKRINPIYILLGIYGATAAMIVAVMLMDRRDKVNK